MLKPYLPLEGFYMIRYHSFYGWHRENEYQHLLQRAGRRHRSPGCKALQPVRPLPKNLKLPESGLR